MIPERAVWVFIADVSRAPAGVFSSQELAEKWIERNRLSGTLSAYPLDQGTLDWAITNDLVNIKPEKLESKRNDPWFIGDFLSASQEHFHYENGKPA